MLPVAAPVGLAVLGGETPPAASGVGPVVAGVDALPGDTGLAPVGPGDCRCSDNRFRRTVEVFCHLTVAEQAADFL